MSPIERSAGGGGGGFTNPMTTAGDIIIENAVPAPARLAIGAAGTQLGISGGLPSWVTPPGAEIGYAQITTTFNITDLAENTATAIISSGSLTFDGAPVLLSVFLPRVTTPTATSVVDGPTFTLFEGATQIGRLGILSLANGTTAFQMSAPVFLSYRFTPTVGAHTYKFCAFVNSTTGTPAIACGAGGTGVSLPAYMRFTKV